MSGGAALAVAVAPIAWWAEREVALGQCSAAPCRNVATLRGQRDAAAALSVSALVTAVGLAATGLGLSITGEAGAAEVALRCSPFGAGLACEGRF